MRVLAVRSTSVSDNRRGARSGEPAGDLSRPAAALLTAWMLAALAIAALAFRAESIPLAALLLAAVAALAPLWPLSHLAVARHAATTVAATNGSLLVFIASLAFNALTPEDPRIGEADARWILAVAVAVAALVSALGAGIVVRRAQLHDTFQRSMECEQIASIERKLEALMATSGAAPGRSRSETRRATWLLVGFAAAVGISRLRRRHN